MKHLEIIRSFIRTLINSDTFHALIVESLPGLGKSTAIDTALSECGVEGVAVGAYATPLHIYNSICKHPNSILVLDDVAGLFSDPKSMAILKAATWQSSGQGKTGSNNQQPRRVSWGSTSDKVEQSTTEFSGKLILLTNSIPAGKETEAFLSRCLSYRIRMSEADIGQVLLEAAESKQYFSDSQLARKVVRFLMDRAHEFDLMRVNFRTVKMGYDFALTHPETWEELFVHVLPRRAMNPPQAVRSAKKDDPEAHIRELLSSQLSTKEKEARFVSLTGKSRRTFYNYQKRLGLSRSYRTER
jgi:hypothetical protein